MYVAFSDSKGNFEISGVQTGNYNVIVKASAKVSAIQRNVTVNGAISDPVQLALKLTPTGDISGRNHYVIENLKKF
ncbi:MAG: carboxypeptidase regulatory-like domain-containing protein, partial [Candidatus Riflebacteria bacterium]|nr:carboxypeptidase regulatory-like domain-containing protein [Candidatus Riflebacteria bacterium]